MLPKAIYRRFFKREKQESEQGLSNSDLNEENLADIFQQLRENNAKSFEFIINL